MELDEFGAARSSTEGRMKQCVLSGSWALTGLVRQFLGAVISGGCAVGFAQLRGGDGDPRRVRGLLNY